MTPIKYPELYRKLRRLASTGIIQSEALRLLRANGYPTLSWDTISDYAREANVKFAEHQFSEKRFYPELPDRLRELAKQDYSFTMACRVLRADGYPTLSPTTARRYCKEFGIEFRSWKVQRHRHSGQDCRTCKWAGDVCKLCYKWLLPLPCELKIPLLILDSDGEVVWDERIVWRALYGRSPEEVIEVRQGQR